MAAATFSSTAPAALFSSACGRHGFATRVLMNLISLICLCSLSPESLLLFNGVLQSYLISPWLSPSMPQTPNNALQPVEKKGKESTLCLSDLC